jgi:hypothetical protein
MRLDDGYDTKPNLWTVVAVALEWPRDGKNPGSYLSD